MTRELEAFIQGNSVVVERNFARNFTHNHTLELYFELNNRSYTDGNIIVIDPTTNNAYKDQEAFEGAQDFFRVVPRITYSQTQALRILAHSINIHESLHVLYSNFPIQCNFFGLSIDEMKVLGLISNIIEDAFIEQVASTKYSGFRELLYFRRMYVDNSKFYDEKKAPTDDATKLTIVGHFLNFTIKKYLNPFYDVSNPEGDIKTLDDATKDLFKKAIRENNPNKRDQLAIDILIEIALVLNDLTVDNETIKGLINEHRHTFDFSLDHKGETFSADTHVKNKSLDTSKLSTFFDAVDLMKGQFSGKTIPLTHEHIKYIEDVFPYDSSLENEYKLIKNEVYQKHQKILRHFDKLMIDSDLVPESKHIIGSTLDSRRLYDPKKRFWIKQSVNDVMVDFSVLFLVDASGSMYQYDQSVIEILVLLHELLKRLEIHHGIMTYNTSGGGDTVYHAVLKQYEDTFNNATSILRYEPRASNRDGFSLRVAHNYIQKHQHSKNPCLFVISDGRPVHSDSKAMYMGEAAISDMKQAIQEIERDKIHLFAFAFNDCYDDLSMIYDSLVRCDTPESLVENLIDTLLKVLKYF